MGQRKHLSLVKNDYAIRYVVKLSARARFVRKQAFKKLHVACNNNRRVPVFCRKAPVVFIAVIDIAVVLNYVFRAENVLKFFRVLLNYRVVGNDVYHPAHIVGRGVVQRKRHA